MTDAGRKAVGFDLLLLGGLALVLRVVALALHPAWTDEAMTMFVAKFDAGLLWKTIVSVDVNPPLHYFLLWLWAKAGDSIAFLRFPSVVFGVVSVAWLYVLGRRVGGRLTGWVAGLVLAVTPLAVYQSNQARYPALMLLLAVAASWYCLRLIEGGRARHAVGFAVATSAMVYTHYFGYLVAAFLFAYSALCFTRAASRRLLIGAWAAVAAAVLAWVPLLVRAAVMRESAGGGDHVPLSRAASYFSIYFTTGFSDWNLPLFWPNLLIGTAVAPTARIALSVALAAPLFLLAFVGLFKRDDRREIRLLAPLWFVIPTGMMFLALLAMDVYKPYYTLPFLPGLALLAGQGASVLASKSRAAAVIAVAVVVAISAGALADYLAPKAVKEDWRQMAHILKDQGREGDVVLHYNFVSRQCLSNYDDSGLPARYVTEGHKGVHFVGPGMPEETFPEIVRDFERVWIIGYYPMRMDTGNRTLAYADEHLFPLAFDDPMTPDPRFFLRLYATSAKVAERGYRAAIDFATGDPTDQLGEGWYPGEGPWRWIGERATVRLRRPENARRIRVTGAANLGLLGAGSVALAVSCEGQAAGEIVASGGFEFAGDLSMPETCFEREIVSVTIEADRTFVPDEVLADGDRTKKSVLIGTVGLVP